MKCSLAFIATVFLIGVSVSYAAPKDDENVPQTGSEKAGNQNKEIEDDNEGKAGEVDENEVGNQQGDGEVEEMEQTPPKKGSTRNKATEGNEGSAKKKSKSTEAMDSDQEDESTSMNPSLIGGLRNRRQNRVCPLRALMRAKRENRRRIRSLWSDEKRKARQNFREAVNRLLRPQNQ